MRQTKTRNSKTAGFTLFELALVLIISALLTTIFFAAFSYQALVAQRNQTLTSLSNVEAALTEYVGNTLHYPCPADPTLDPSSPGYGVANCAAAGVTTVAAVQGNTGAPDSVVIGAVPFVTMGPSLNYTHISGIDSIDGWGRKLGYAVTKSMTVSPVNDRNGAIAVVDENLLSVVQPAGTAHAVILSYGEDGLGAYTRSGGLVQSCGSAGPAPPSPPAPPPVGDSEIDNCNNADSQFLSGLRSTYPDLHYYNDDIVKFITVQSNELWTIKGCLNCPPAAPTIYQVENANPGNVGIGVDTPTQKMDIAGGIVANNGGNIQTTSFCDQTTGTVCMPPAKLGGADPLMDCSILPAAGGPSTGGPGMVMTGISNGQAVCSSAFPTVPPTYHCPAGSYISAISNVGTVVCNTP